jgi:dTDP-4-amino-4,6-dideoxygalactose transaminase
MSKSTKLAIHGGPKAVPKGLIQKWPEIDDTDRKMVLASLNGLDHAFGPNCQAFQKEFAAWNGNKYAITTNSGTAALHMAVVASGCGTGDEVIVPAYSWSSSATCVLQHNCIPVFVDIDYDTMNIDVDKIEAAIRPRTKAILVVHLHGLACDMDKVMAVAKKHNLKVIEDACQAHGATFKGKKVGTIGHSAAFSFNQNKNLCSGEGGMFVTNDEEMLKKAQSLWSFGEASIPSQKRDYHVYAMGWMYRNNDLTAAFGRSQLKKLDRNLKLQTKNGRLMTKLLEGTPGLIVPQAPKDFGHNYYNYTLRFDMQALGHAKESGAFRDKLVDAMNAEGVHTGVWQAFPLPAMTVFQAKNGYGKGCPWDCPHANPVDYRLDQYPEAFRHCDTHTGMTVPLRHPNGEEAVEATAKGIRKVMENASRL